MKSKLDIKIGDYFIDLNERYFEEIGIVKKVEKCDVVIRWINRKIEEGGIKDEPYLVQHKSYRLKKNGIKKITKEKALVYLL